MKVHHLNCGTMNGLALKPLNGTGGWIWPGRVVLHCLLIETTNRLVLIDTGWGLNAYFRPSRIERVFRKIVRSVDDPSESAARQIELLGWHTQDVTDILMTHLHLDHAGGLRDFPQATVHVYDVEYRTAVRERTWYESAHLPIHWSHQPNWEIHKLGSESWYGFESTTPFLLGGIEVRFIPTPGHTRGHCMVAIHHNRRWIVHAGDTYFYHGQVDGEKPHLPPGGNVVKKLLSGVRVASSLYAYDEQLLRLQEKLGSDLTLFCSHDPIEFDMLAHQIDM